MGLTELQQKHIIRQWLTKYNTGMLIETGSHEGEGIEAAFAFGFKQVISVEFLNVYYWHCFHRFYDRIRSGELFLFLGDSVLELPNMLKFINKRVTFWLDAHLAGKCPILAELECIKEHHIKDHIILIDDVNDFGTPAMANITIDQIKWAILQINDRYKFSFESTGIKNNVLVATI
jgi:hypothetical protein